jgi:hypothetical protein
MPNHSRLARPKHQRPASHQPGVPSALGSRHCAHWHRPMHRVRRPQQSKRTSHPRKVRRPGAQPIASGSPQGSGPPPPTPLEAETPLMLGAMLNRVAALRAEIAASDAELGPELRDTTRRVVVLVRLLEAPLARVAELEQRLGQVIGSVEASTGRRGDDEVYECLAGQLGLLRVRSALKRLGLPQPAMTRSAPRASGRLPGRL